MSKINSNQLNHKDLISPLIPKISDYFTKNKYLEKSKLSEFLSFIGLTIILEKEKDLNKLWIQLSKNNNNKENLKGSVPKDILIKNLSNYIKSHNTELFQPDESLRNSVLDFISNPKNLNIEIDPDNDHFFELYHLLATLPFNDDKNYKIALLNDLLNDYNFINLNKDCMELTLEDLLKEKVNIIKKEQYMIIMEEMEKKFGNILEEKSNIKKVFTQEELDHAELKEFDNIDKIIKILLNILGSLYSIHNKYKQISKNDDNYNYNEEYINRYFNIFINNEKLFIYEINRIFNLQKQKFTFYEYALENKDSSYKEKISELNDEINRLKLVEEIKNIDNIKAMNQEILNEKKKTQKLENDIKSLKQENQKRQEELILSENKIQTLEKNLQEKQNMINTLKKDNEIMSQKYREVLDALDRQIFIEKQKGKVNDEFFKKINLNENQKLLLKKKPEELIVYIVEKDNYCSNLENKNKNLISKITNLEKNIDDMEKEFNEMKSKILTLENKNYNLKKENDDYQKLVDEYQNKNAVYLNNLLEENDNNENEEKIKIKNYKKIKTSQFNYKGKIPKKIKKNIFYDFLCLKLDAKILENLEDECYNANSNLIFSELINYLDEEKETEECALFITSDYLYFFNNITYHKAFSIQLDNLRTVFISPLNNYVSMTFETGQTINFELFRILELMDFIKSLNALHKTRQKIIINMNNDNNQFVPKNPNNFTIGAYHGRAIFSGYLYKRIEGIFTSGFERRFASLTDIGLIIMKEPNGKPSDIINLLFANFEIYNGGDGDYCFSVNIGRVKYTFSVSSDFIRKKWIDEFNNWIKKVKEDESN